MEDNERSAVWEKEKRNYVGYEYKEIVADSSMVSLLLDGYENFGWEVNDSLPENSMGGESLFFGDGAAAALSVSLGRGETKDIHRSVGSAVLGSFLSGVVVITNAVMRELYLTADPVKRAVAAQEKAIRHIADAGSCVIIGRSADYVLRNFPDVVRIFIHAPESYREKKVMEMYGDSPEAAAEQICSYVWCHPCPYYNG